MRLELLYKMAEKEGIEVDAFSLKSRESLSMMDFNGTCCIAIDPFKLASAADEKTKLAHEIGHCITGAFYNDYSPYDIRQKHENKADKWAIENVIPEVELNEAVKEGRTEVWELAEYFGVSEDFVRKAVWWYQHGNLAVDQYL